MTALDQFPADHNAILKDLQRQINQLSAEVKQVRGVPITQASAAFFIPSASEPAAPPSGAYLYVEGNEVRVRSAGFDYSTLPPDVPQASSMNDASPILSGNAPGSYNATWGQNIYEGLVDVKDTLNTLLSRLRATSPPLLDS